MEVERQPWKRSKASDADKMGLPAGKTCGGSAHFRLCNKACSHIAADEDCDWSPSQFRPRPNQPTTKERT